MAAFAAKYSGEYADGSYVNEGIGMDWQLPEGWHFYNDDEMTSYNGGSAKEILLKKEPIYAFAAVNDSYDTMTSNRSYRKYLPQDVVRSEIEKNLGTQFDPQAAKAMLEIIDKDTKYMLHE